MKTSIRLLSVAVITLAASLTNLNAQTQAPPADPETARITNAISQVFTFAEQSTNLMGAGYGIVSSDGKKYGGGIALAYKLSDMIAPVVRLDVYDGSLWMPSGSMQLQFPIRLGKVEAVPLMFSGLATPIAGKRIADGEDIVGIFGMGMAIRVSQKWDVVADYEHWTASLGNQIRFGALFKF